MEIKLDRPLYLAADMQTVVEEGDERAAYVLGGKGSTVASPDLERLGLRLEDGAVAYPGLPANPVGLMVNTYTHNFPRDDADPVVYIGFPADPEPASDDDSETAEEPKADAQPEAGAAEAPEAADDDESSEPKAPEGGRDDEAPKQSTAKGRGHPPSTKALKAPPSTK